MANVLARLRVFALWTLTILVSLGIGLAGVTKFPVPNGWRHAFLTWGYPPWFVFGVGAAEVIGAIALLIPRFALRAIGLLLVLMIGALVTLLAHPGDARGWGATPALYIAMLTVIAALRWKSQARA